MINLNDTPPRRVSPTFVHSVNSLGVQTPEGWEYYPMKVDSEPNGRFMFITQAPAVLADGILALAGKRYFKVSKQDIVRRRIDVNNQCDKPGAGHTHSSVSNTTDSDQLADFDKSSEDSPRADGTNWSKECANANMAYEQQVAALYGLSDSEEAVWQVPGDS